MTDRAQHAILIFYFSRLIELFHTKNKRDKRSFRDVGTVYI